MNSPRSSRHLERGLIMTNKKYSIEEIQIMIDTSYTFEYFKSQFKNSHSPNPDQEFTVVLTREQLENIYILSSLYERGVMNRSGNGSELVKVVKNVLSNIDDIKEGRMKETKGSLMGNWG